MGGLPRELQQLERALDVDVLLSFVSTQCRDVRACACCCHLMLRLFLWPSLQHARQRADCVEGVDLMRVLPPDAERGGERGRERGGRGGEAGQQGGVGAAAKAEAEDLSPVRSAAVKKVTQFAWEHIFCEPIFAPGGQGGGQGPERAGAEAQSAARLQGVPTFWQRYSLGRAGQQGVQGFGELLFEMLALLKAGLSINNARAPSLASQLLPSGSGRASGQAGSSYNMRGGAGNAKFLQLLTILSLERKHLGPVHRPSSPVRFLPVSQYLLEPAFGVWALECGVLTSPRACKAYRFMFNTAHCVSSGGKPLRGNANGFRKTERNRPHYTGRK